MAQWARRMALDGDVVLIVLIYAKISGVPPHEYAVESAVSHGSLKQIIKSRLKHFIQNPDCRTPGKFSASKTHFISPL